jgi:hypothetical protein
VYIYLIIYIIKETSNTFLFFINDNSIKNNALAEIKDLERKLSEEHDKNDQLNKIVQNQNKPSRKGSNIEELENEIKLFRAYYKFSPDEKLISIEFMHSPDIDYTIIAKNTDDFVKIEKELYDKYPDYRNFENDFLLNGIKIKKYKTLKENNIKNKDIITLIKKNNYD